MNMAKSLFKDRYIRETPHWVNHENVVNDPAAIEEIARYYMRVDNNIAAELIALQGMGKIGMLLFGNSREEMLTEARAQADIEVAEFIPEIHEAAINKVS